MADRESTNTGGHAAAGTGPTNAEFARNNLVFRAACKEAGIEPSKRQASKFRREQGIAHQTRRKLLRRLPRVIERERDRIRIQVEKLDRVRASVAEDSAARAEISKLMDLHEEPLLALLRRLRALKDGAA